MGPGHAEQTAKCELVTLRCQLHRARPDEEDPWCRGHELTKHDKKTVVFVIFGMLYQFMPGERALHRQLVDQIKAIHSNHLETNERRNHHTEYLNTLFLRAEIILFILHHGELL